MKTSPLEVLMVDDAQMDIDLFRGLFRETAPGLSFHAALTFQDALKHLEAVGLPDLMLLDLNMPDGDGHEFLAHLKAQPQLKRLPVVILTDSDQEGDVLRAYTGLASAYIVKPTTYDDCRAMVNALQDFWKHVKLPHS